MSGCRSYTVRSVERSTSAPDARGGLFVVGSDDRGFQFRQALVVGVQALVVGFEPCLLFEVDAEQGRQQRVLVVQQAARVGVLASVLEQPIEVGLVATPERTPEIGPPLLDGAERVPVRRVSSSHRYRPPAAVHASSSGFAATAICSPSAVTPVPTPSGVADGGVLAGSRPTCVARASSSCRQ